MKTRNPFKLSRRPLALFSVVCSLGAGADSPDSAKTTELKSFLQNQPPIDNLVVSVRELYREKKWLANIPAPAGEVVEKPIRYYHGSRSGTNFFLREVASVAVAEDLNKWIRIDVRNKNEAIDISANAATIATFKHDRAEDNPTIGGAEIMGQIFDSFINFGVLWFDHNTLVWTGNRFTTSPKELGFAPVVGELTISNNAPSFLTISTTNSIVIRKCDFSYSTLGATLPNSVIIHQRTSMGFIPVTEVVIHRLAIADKIDESRFTLDYLARPGNEQLQFTNLYDKGALYEASRGRATPIRSLNPPTRPPPKQSPSVKEDLRF